MFIRSCFIRKNTIELRNKLKDLGYKVDSISPESECIATCRIIPSAVGISEEQFDTTNPHRTWNCAERVDCKKNEDLFLAISSLRDDSDKNQWFTYNNKWWVLCKEDKFNSEKINTIEFHKATVEELIEHFNM